MPGWPPKSNAELKAAIAECLKASTDCSKGPHGPIGSWDVSSVTDMRQMFASASSFNGDISNWDVLRVTTMEEMFFGASSFAQTLCGAWVTSTANKDGMFDDSSGQICTTTSTSKTTSMKTLIQILTNALTLSLTRA